MHALIGDVCGRGPAEAALGVCLRVAWRTLVLAVRPADEILATLNELLEHEREDDTMFATMCMVSVAPERNTGWVRMAGHLPPLLVTRGGVREVHTPTAPPLGLGRVRDWPGTSRAEEDVVRSYSLHANAFVSKPVDFENFIEAIRQIDTFFLTLVCLPTGPGS